MPKLALLRKRMKSKTSCIVWNEWWGSAIRLINPGVACTYPPAPTIRHQLHIISLPKQTSKQLLNLLFTILP
nr:MAG TPA: hypothetical protein [Crassvirales sp.]